MEMNHTNHNRRVTGTGIGNGNTSFQSNTSSSSSHSHSLTHSNSHSQNNNNQSHQDTSSSSDPMQSWWESLSKSRSRIQSLLSLLPVTETETDSNNSFPSLIDSDRPARSLLDSFDVFTALSSSLTGSGDDPLCHWLYDTYQFPETDDLRLVVLSFIPVLTGMYLTRVHASSTTTPSSDSPSLAGFEAVLLAIYSSQTKLRGGKGVVVNIPTPEYLAGFPSLYHSVPSVPGGKLSNSPKEGSIGVGVLCPPLEPQVGIKSTKRAFIIGIAFQCYYAQISQMPSWSKIELCKFAASWAGHDCPCVLSLQDDRDDNVNDNLDSFSNGGASEGDTGDRDGVRIPLPWELLQPILRILGHCLLAPPPLVSDEVKEAAASAVSRLYARASHDLDPQAILATRALVQLHGRARAAAEAAAFANASSAVTTPTSVKKSPEMLLVSQ